VRIQYAHLCDFANVTAEGKSNLLGIFSAIFPPAVPYRIPAMYLAFALECHYTDIGRPIQIRIECVDADGHHVFRASTNLQVGKRDGTSARLDDSPVIPQLLRLTGVEFKTYGAHDVNFFVRDSLDHTLRFMVAKRPEPAAAP
jgi:hypothetical protein